MSNEKFSIDKEYLDFIDDIKSQVYKSQIKASISVNKELLKLYWN